MPDALDKNRTQSMFILCQHSVAMERVCVLERGGSESYLSSFSSHTFHAVVFNPSFDLINHPAAEARGSISS